MVTFIQTVALWFTAQAVLSVLLLIWGETPRDWRAWRLLWLSFEAYMAAWAWSLT